MQLREINIGTQDYEEMIDLRMKVLLNPIGILVTYINTAKEKEDILIGAFKNNKLAGCCILSKVDGNVLQLRQMAVDTVIQNKGIGRVIISFAEKLATEKGYQILMMHARDAVIEFYSKCRYESAGEQFFEVGIGHHKMEKKLQQSGNGTRKDREKIR